MSEVEPIRLDQYLKLINAVSSGGEAKHLIQSGQVMLNGQIETRRGRKLTVGDVIKLAELEYTVTLTET